ncbi:hypothetical protein [uncultured Streptomyces sp.]|uniref:hypothetical protein n=1 Tax=uncultured Streptomyces sp. TaxID=174707 RepID=UPI00260781B4|nr:hypothetical protein [uncultured Streptomyces sp.]
MISLGVFVGLLAALVVFLIVTLVRRGNRATENADGLLIEQARRTQAHDDRSSYSSMTVHNTFPTTRDARRP